MGQGIQLLYAEKIIYAKNNVACVCVLHHKHNIIRDAYLLASLCTCTGASAIACAPFHSGECPDLKGPLTSADPDEGLRGIQGEC